MYANTDLLASVFIGSRLSTGSIIISLLKGEVPQTLKPAIICFIVIAFTQALEKSCENELQLTTTPGLRDKTSFKRFLIGPKHLLSYGWDK